MQKVLPVLAIVILCVHGLTTLAQGAALPCPALDRLLSNAPLVTGDLPYTAESFALDPYTGRLYILDSGGTLHILDNGVETASETGVAGTLAVNPATGKLYVATPDEIRIFDSATMQEVDSITPDGDLAVNACAGQLLVTDESGVRLLDAATHAELGTIPGLIQIPDEMTEAMQGYPPRTFESYPVRALPNPAGNDYFVILRSPRCLHGGCWQEDSLTVRDGATFELLWDAGAYGYRSTVIDPLTGLIYHAEAGHYDRSYSDTVEVRQPDGAVIHTFDLFGMLALDPAAGRLYVNDGDFLTVIDTTSREMIDRYRLDGWQLLGALNGYLIVQNSDGIRIAAAETFATAQRRVVKEALPTGILSRAEIALGSGTLFLETSTGLYRSTDDGTGWQQVFACEQNSRVTFAPDGDLFLHCVHYIPIAGIGLFRSSDDGLTWQSINRGLPGLDYVYPIFSPDYQRDHTLWVRAADDYLSQRPVMVSHDSGDSWTEAETSPYAEGFLPAFIFVSPPQDALTETTARCDGTALISPQVVGYASGRQAFATALDTALTGDFVNVPMWLYRLADGCWQETGITFSNLFQFGQPSIIMSIPIAQITYGPDGVVYAVLNTSKTTDNGSSFAYDSILYRSTDDGQTWTEIVRSTTPYG